MKPKSFAALVATLGLVLSVAAPAQAESFDADELRRPFEKLGRGVINIVLSPLEIFNAYSSEGERYHNPIDNSDNIIEFAIVSPAVAVGYTVVRAGVGVVDVVTFPFPLPNYGYDELYSPEYVRPFWEKGD